MKSINTLCAQQHKSSERTSRRRKEERQRKRKTIYSSSFICQAPSSPVLQKKAELVFGFIISVSVSVPVTGSDVPQTTGGCPLKQPRERNNQRIKEDGRQNSLSARRPISVLAWILDKAVIKKKKKKCWTLFDLNSSHISLYIGLQGNE